MSGRTAFFSYRLLARFAEVLPTSALRPLSKLVAAVAVAASPARAALVQRHLQRITGKPASRASVRRAFASYVRYWLEAFRLPVIPAAQLDARLTVDGFEHLRQALDEGRGVITALPHLGNWDFAGAWLAQQGVPVTVVVERLQPRELFRWFADFRRTLGFEVLVNGPGIGAELLAALRAGRVVVLLCDRDVDGTGMEAEFFGESTYVPRGPAVLALRSGAALVSVHVRERGSGHHLTISAPLESTRRGKLREDVARVTVALTRATEDAIRSAPEEWHCFQPNWPSDPGWSAARLDP